MADSTHAQYGLGNGLVISSPFGMRNGRLHNGIDYGAIGGSAGKPIYALCDGVIEKAGSSKNYGSAVFVKSRDEDGLSLNIEYGHIVPVAELSRGQTVKAGQLLGYIGTKTELQEIGVLTKEFTKPHLHLRTWLNGQPEDPLKVKFPASSGVLIGTDTSGNRLVVRESGSAAEGTYKRTVDILDKNTGERIGMILKQRSDLSDDYLQDFVQSGEMPSTIQVGEGSDSITYIPLSLRQEDVSDFLAANPQFAQEGRSLSDGLLMVAKEGERVRMPDGIDYVAVSSTDKIAFGSTPNTSGTNLVNAADYDDYQRGALLSSFNLMGQGLIPQINMLSDMPQGILGSLGQGFSGLGLSQAGVSSVLPSSAQFMPSLGYVADPSATGLSAAPNP